MEINTFKFPSLLNDHLYYKRDEMCVGAGSYRRNEKDWRTTWEDVLNLCNNEILDLIYWFQKFGWLKKNYICPVCDNYMRLVEATSSHKSSDIYVWMCRRMVNGKRHFRSRSIRKGSWIENCNLNLSEILKLTYMWAQKYTMTQIKHEMKTSGNTVASWNSECRDMCTELCLVQGEAIGGENIEVEIDETKIGKLFLNNFYNFI